MNNTNPEKNVSVGIVKASIFTNDPKAQDYMLIYFHVDPLIAKTDPNMVDFYIRNKQSLAELQTKIEADLTKNQRGEPVELRGGLANLISLNNHLSEIVLDGKDVSLPQGVSLDDVREIKKLQDEPATEQKREIKEIEHGDRRTFVVETSPTEEKPRDFGMYRDPGTR